MKFLNFNLKNRNILSFFLCLIIVCVFTLSIAYAVLSSTLTISGGADVVAASWDVHFENQTVVSEISNDSLYDYEVSPLAVWSCQSGIDCIIKVSDLKLEFTTSPILLPGDFRAFSFDVVNAGTIAAELDTFILSGLSEEQDQYLNYYVKYEDGNEVKVGDVLSSSTRKKLMLVIEFDKNITETQLPITSQDIELSYTMNYVQSD